MRLRCGRETRKGKLECAICWTAYGYASVHALNHRLEERAAVDSFTAAFILASDCETPKQPSADWLTAAERPGMRNAYTMSMQSMQRVGSTDDLLKCCR